MAALAISTGQIAAARAYKTPALKVLTEKIALLAVTPDYLTIADTAGVKVSDAEKAAWQAAFPLALAAAAALPVKVGGK